MVTTWGKRDVKAREDAVQAFLEVEEKQGGVEGEATGPGALGRPCAEATGPWSRGGAPRRRR